ncbi:S1C family serine protease [Schaalia odontolytica]
MTEPQNPTPDLSRANGEVPTYAQRSTADDPAATQELRSTEATREMPSATTIPAPPAVPVSPADESISAAPKTGTPCAEDAPAAGGAYAAPSGEPYVGYAAPASPEAVGAPTIVVTKKGPGWLALFAAMLLTVGLTLGTVFYARPAMLRASTPTNLNGGTVATVPASNSSGTDWTDVASAVSPAVVTIQAQGASSGGTGSGVIYDAQGDIVTNYHVISSVLGGGQIQVTLADGRLYSASIVGHDKTTDLAVIRLDNPPSDLTVARFATSANLEVGAPVMAIGAPLGLSNTVTTGIVSALNRPVEVSMDESATSEDGSQASSDLVVTNAIQIDASINPGNSGGPLFDASGAVIGINSSIKSLASSSDGQAGSIGLGFAIPSDLVVSVADQLIASGSASHGTLGVTVKAATTTVGSDTYVGAQVQEVSAGSGASAAGIRAGDVIVKVEGQEVTSPKQLIGYVRRYKAGDSVSMTIVRDGTTQDVSVRIS